MATDYCTEAQVISQLRMIDQSSASHARKTLSASSDPTTSEVTEYINDAEAEIDHYCQRAWREVTEPEETHIIKRSPGGYGNWGTQYLGFAYTVFVKLHFPDVRALSTDTDKIEYTDGQNWIDLLATGTESTVYGDGGDFYIDLARGFLYFLSVYPRADVPSVRVTYRHGKSTVPGDIRRAAKLLAATTILESDWFTRQFPTNTAGPNAEAMADKWTKKAYKLLARHTRFVTV